MAQEYLKRVPTSSGNSYKFTISVWAKRNADSTSHRGHLFNAGPGASLNDAFAWYLNSGYNLHLWDRVGGTYAYYMTPTARYRDYSGWTHYLASIDTTQYGLQENKVVEYVNGVRQTASNNSVTPILQDYESWVNQRVGHYIGKRLDTLNGNWHGQMMDFYLVDGLSLTPDTFGFYKVGDGFVSAGTTYATDFRPGQWVPKAPSVVKNTINNNGGFGVNGVYLPLNDSSNFGADFHTTPNSIIKLQEDLQQPKVSITSTAQAGLAYTDVLRADPYAANLVLAVPGVTGGIGTNGTSSGINTGFGDYSALIKGSGSPKIMELSSNLSIGATAAYYGSAMLFNGTDTQLTTSTDLTDFAFGTGDFTLECWYAGEPEQRPLFELRGASASTNNLFVGANGEIFLGGSQQIEAATGITTAQFTHIAVERTGELLTRYINGVATGIKTNFTADVAAPNTEARFGMDQSGGSFYDGYIQDLRVYKGVAKYKGGFDVARPYTPVGIATWRAVPDTTANNFATLNFVNNNGTTLSNGSLTVDTGTTNGNYVNGTIALPQSGKWYWEIVPTTNGSKTFVGIDTAGGGGTTSVLYFANDGDKYVDGVQSTYGATYTDNDVIGIAANVTSNTITFYKNGVSQGNISYNISGINTTYFPRFSDGTGATGTVINVNFGQNPTFSGNINAGVSTFTDSNGKGLFRYEPPTDFLALCTDNLPTPAISNPGKYFKTQLYIGDGNSSRSIAGIGFTPDLVWTKHRSGAGGHGFYDSVRGVGLRLDSQSTGAESASQGVVSFDSDGFSLGSTFNADGATTVAWCWQAGAGTTSANTDGSVDSVISVNQDAGFSIVSYTGNGVNGATIGHGLEKAPAFIIAKGRSNAVNWPVYHKSTTASNFLYLNTTSAAVASSAMWNSNPSSSVFYVGNQAQNNTSGVKYIAYCWAEIEGFSKFGSYVGDNTTDNAFVYCGFKPAFVIIKNIDAADNWNLEDSSRQSTNPTRAILRANVSNAEVISSSDAFDVDLLSNGFKIRGANSEVGDPVKYIFAAWAESPFTTANAK